jgi:hypothetical protein
MVQLSKRVSQRALRKPAASILRVLISRRRQTLVVCQLRESGRQVRLIVRNVRRVSADLVASLQVRLRQIGKVGGVIR